MDYVLVACVVDHAFPRSNHTVSQRSTWLAFTDPLPFCRLRTLDVITLAAPAVPAFHALRPGSFCWSLLPPRICMPVVVSTPVRFCTGAASSYAGYCGLGLVVSPACHCPDRVCGLYSFLVLRACCTPLIFACLLLPTCAFYLHWLPLVLRCRSESPAGGGTDAAALRSVPLGASLLILYPGVLLVALPSFALFAGWIRYVRFTCSHAAFVNFTRIRAGVPRMRSAIPVVLRFLPFFPRRVVWNVSFGRVFTRWVPALLRFVVLVGLVSPLCTLSSFNGWFCLPF